MAPYKKYLLHVELALRARRVNPGLDPGGKGNGLVGEGLDTVRARLACFFTYEKLLFYGEPYF